MPDLEWVCIGWELDEKNDDTRNGGREREFVRECGVWEGKARLEDT